jgi:uncharacterized protein YegL
MSKENLCEIICVIDRSGSMNVIKSDAIGGFNQFLEEQKKLPGEATLTRVIFDEVYEIMDDNKPLAEINPFDETTFVPRGSTALLDAIGRSISTVTARQAGLPEEQKPAKTIMVILTDGEENASHEFNRQQVFDMIKECQTKGWQFLYLAANQDAVREGAKYGFAANQTMNFAYNSVGTRGAYRCMSKSVSAFRGDKSDDDSNDNTK